MKVFVIFDKQGRITGTVTSALNNIDVRSGEGRYAHKFEVGKLDPKDLPAYLSELHTKFRVETLGEPKLVPMKITPSPKKT